MATVNTFSELEVWKLANDLEKKIYQILQAGTLAKDYELKNQMSRSSGSIMDNIAEGFGRGGRLEFIQFLSIARASCSELQSQLIRCFNRNHIVKEIFDTLFQMAELIGKKIGAFIQYLNKSAINGLKFQNRLTLKSSNQNQQVIHEQETIQKPETNQKLETRNLISTSNAAKPLGAYPHARRADNLLFLSGIGSRNPVNNTIPGLELDATGNILKYDIEAECHQCFANVKAVLEAAGSSWGQIIDVTVFLTNMKKDFPVYNKIYGEYFNEVQACRTTVEIKSLPTPIAIELKVVAAN